MELSLYFLVSFTVTPNCFYCFFLQKLYAEFEMQGLEEDKLDTPKWQSVQQRMQTEEAACVLTGADTGENG